MPYTVGELRKLIKGLPDKMAFDLDVRCDSGYVDETTMNVQNGRLVLKVRVEANEHWEDS